MRYSKFIYIALLHPLVLINADGLMNEIAVLLAGLQYRKWGLEENQTPFPMQSRALLHSSSTQCPSTPCHKCETFQTIKIENNQPSQTIHLFQ